MVGQVILEVDVRQWLLVMLLVGCAGSGDDGDPSGDDDDDVVVVVDHTGVERRITSGFSVDWGEGQRGIVLTNMDDACESMTWWADREASLLRIFFDSNRDDELMQDAVDNTAAVYEAEMSTAAPFAIHLSIEDIALDEEVELPGATRSSDIGDAVFWTYAELLSRPVFTTDGSGATMDSTEWEAGASGGDGTFTFSSDGASGSFNTRFETDELAQFDFSGAFDVEPCQAYVEAVSQEL